MRGPPSLAMRVPVKLPAPPVDPFCHVPPALPAAGLTALSVQGTTPHGDGRVRLPVTAWLPLFGLVSMLPSMQSMSPRRTAGPAAPVADCVMTTSQVPFPAPGRGPAPCHEPAHTPERSGGACVEVLGLPPPPPPQPVSIS